MGCDNAGIPETGENIDILIKKKGTSLLISNFGTYWDRRPSSQASPAPQSKDAVRIHEVVKDLASSDLQG